MCHWTWLSQGAGKRTQVLMLVWQMLSHGTVPQLPELFLYLVLDDAWLMSDSHNFAFSKFPTWVISLFSIYSLPRECAGFGTHQLQCPQWPRIPKSNLYPGRRAAEITWKPDDCAHVENSAEAWVIVPWKPLMPPPLSFPNVVQWVAALLHKCTQILNSKLTDKASRQRWARFQGLSCLLLPDDGWKESQLLCASPGCISHIWQTLYI